MKVTENNIDKQFIDLIPITMVIIVFCSVFTVFLSGCKSPSDYRLEADKAAGKIIEKKTEEVTGRAQKINVERPSDIFRRRLMLEQNLIYTNETTLGTDKLAKIEHWPEPNYPSSWESLDPIVVLEVNEPVKLTLLEALQIGARNSFDYQKQKETVFQNALALDLEADAFRNTFIGQVETLLSTDNTASRTVSGSVTSGSAGISRQLESGAQLSTAIAIDLANLFTLGGYQALGSSADASISIPLLRGSGKHIVTEPLTQAERDVVYAIYEFERFKKTFAVDVGSQYLSVLNQLDEVKNSEGNYRSLIASSRRSRRLADAGKMGSIEVDQAIQNELRARERWIRSIQSYRKSLDSFKGLLGLPPDARVELDRDELERLVAPTVAMMEEIAKLDQIEKSEETPPADAPINLVEPTREGAGRYEIDEEKAMRLALDNRLDLRVAMGKVYDAQRTVIIAADQLRAEFTIFGSAKYGQSRSSVNSAMSEDGKLRFDKANYTALLTLDLPFERTRERNLYRNSLINLEQAERNVQLLEDRIKLSIVNELRDLMQARESLYIQAKAVYVAEKRVRSTTLFLEAGRAQMRDLLEAQESLLSAQNSLTAAVVNYRVAELQIQRDMELLEIDENGIWREYDPEGS